MVERLPRGGDSLPMLSLPREVDPSVSREFVGEKMRDFRFIKRLKQ